MQEFVTWYRRMPGSGRNGAAAAGVDDLPGYVGGGGRGEEGDDAGDVVRGADPPGRDFGDELGEDVGRHRLGHRRVDQARGAGVAADARRPALGERPAEADQPRLRGAVVGLAEVAERGARAEVDDRGAVAVARLERQGEADRGGQGDVDDGGEGWLLHLRRGGGA